MTTEETKKEIAKKLSIAKWLKNQVPRTPGNITALRTISVLESALELSLKNQCYG